MRTLNLNLNQFHEFVQNKKCICFGSGLQGLRTIGIFDNWNKTSDIILFIDNEGKKWGRKIKYGEYSYPILCVNEALEFINEDVVVLITCSDIIRVRTQLEQYEELNNIYCFSLIELGQQQLCISDYEKIVSEYEEPVIPKKIHYCWFGGQMPDLMKRNVENWHKVCPDYQIIRWDESNYDISKNQYMKEAYELEQWGFVPDYMRLDIIYNHGGIYLDTDIKLVKRPDALLYQNCFANFDSSLMMNLGSGFGAKPKCNIIKELRDYYDNVNFKSKDEIINNTSCMMHSYNVLKRYNVKINDTLQKVGDMNIYPMIIQGTCIYTKQMRITEKTYFLHYGTTTWLDEKNKIRKRELGKHFENNKEKNLISYVI